jgi:hypothetical protein
VSDVVIEAHMANEADKAGDAVKTIEAIEAN